MSVKLGTGRNRAAGRATRSGPTVAAVLMVVLLGGCATSTMAPDDGGRESSASRAGREMVIPDEPKAKYGNPSSYIVFGKRYSVLNSSDGFVEKGIASWYGQKFHGRRTSSGELYDMYGMTAAHKNLPLPTYVQVTNLANNRSIVLKVNDRGPFHKNRVIDLSYTAARDLDIVREGTGYVEVRALRPGERVIIGSAGPASAQPAEIIANRPEPPARKMEPPASTAQPVASKEATETVSLYLQVGAFSVEDNARRLHERLRTSVGPLSRIEPAQHGEQTVYRVRIGPLDGVSHADQMTDSLVAMGISSPHVVLE